MIIHKHAVNNCNYMHFKRLFFYRTTQLSRYRKAKTNLDFTEARDSEWQWHQLGHMQVCTLSRQIAMPAYHCSVFLQAGCPSCHPSNSVKAPNAKITTVITRRKIVCTLKSYEFIHLCMVSMIAVCDMQYLSMILTLICLQNSIVLLMNRGKKATL